ARTKQTARK
nr:Chain D, Histone H3 [Homo sapiens]3SOU_E Chain E, Histone H3 [Homo sapiens]5F6K_M Chain M, peptide ARTKQTARK [Homo sapiens]7W67_M Chain M, Histone H3.3C [Homo sapiens]7W6L_M Chain M, Histone H3.3C [Homo sapiens]